MDENGGIIEHDLDGLLAICVQHEMDHLEGKLFVDYLSALKRDRLNKKLIKKVRHAPKHESSDRSLTPVI